MIIETTTIRLQRSTKERLNIVGKKGETYDDIILKLISHYIDEAELKAELDVRKIEKKEGV